MRKEKKSEIYRYCNIAIGIEIQNWSSIKNMIAKKAKKLIQSKAKRKGATAKTKFGIAIQFRRPV